jgi:threonyl-tRNA synthetase
VNSTGVDLLDHRDLNQDLGVFATDPLAGAGLPLWLPAGAAIRDELQALAREIARADGCQGVYSPVLGKRALYERSGHWDNFAADMFPPMAVGGDELVLRPANCPHHALIYASAQRSYRELPVRYNELGAMFRAERSGVLSGLSRVRQISLDDTHVFCRPDQVAAEAARSLRAAAAGAGLPDRGLDLVDAPGEAAFYGPKLDLQVRDGRGHEETIATVQLDFNQPDRFDLSYDSPEGTRCRPVMIHRGTVGSMERVTAALLERYQGRLPLWLAPVQVCVLPVGPGQDEIARDLHDRLIAAGLRPRLDADGSLGARIRRARQRRDCLIAVLGEAEAAAGAVQVTDIAARFSGPVAVGDLIRLAAGAHASRQARVDWAPAVTDTPYSKASGGGHAQTRWRSP